MTEAPLKYKKKLWVAPDSTRIPWNWAEKLLLGTVVISGLASVGLALYLFWPREAEAVRDFEYARVQVMVPEELKARFPAILKKLAKDLDKQNCLIEVADTLWLKSPAPEKTLLIKRVPEPPVARQAAKLLKVTPSHIVEKSLDDNIKGVLFTIYLGRDALSAN